MARAESAGEKALNLLPWRGFRFRRSFWEHRPGCPGAREVSWTAKKSQSYPGKRRAGNGERIRLRPPRGEKRTSSRRRGPKRSVPHPRERRTSASPPREPRRTVLRRSPRTNLRPRRCGPCFAPASGRAQRGGREARAPRDWRGLASGPTNHPAAGRRRLPAQGSSCYMTSSWDSPCVRLPPVSPG